MMMPLVPYHPREWDQDGEVATHPMLSRDSNNDISAPVVKYPLSCDFQYVWSSALQGFVLRCGFQRDKILK